MFGRRQRHDWSILLSLILSGLAFGHSVSFAQETSAGEQRLLDEVIRGVIDPSPKKTCSDFNDRLVQLDNNEPSLETLRAANGAMLHAGSFADALHGPNSPWFMYCKWMVMDGSVQRPRGGVDTVRETPINVQAARDLSSLGSPSRSPLPDWLRAKLFEDQAEVAMTAIEDGKAVTHRKRFNLSTAPEALRGACHSVFLAYSHRKSSKTYEADRENVVPLVDAVNVLAGKMAAKIAEVSSLKDIYQKYYESHQCAAKLLDETTGSSDFRSWPPLKLNLPYPLVAPEAAMTNPQ